MNKSVKTLVISLLLIIAQPMAKLSAQVSTWDGTWQPWTHGTGTEADPFLIENAQQLAYLAYRVNNGLDAGGGHVSNHDYHYKLMVDVDLNGSEDFQWTPIGYWNSDSDYQCFGGHFDGNGHKISGLYINNSTNRVGFFGYADGAHIEALGINAHTIATTGQYAGGVIGVATNTTITICYSIGIISSGGNESMVGGIVGYVMAYINISNCYHFGSVQANYCSGGIVGFAANTTSINNCYNTGSATANTLSGGIVGHASGTTTITNCYNTGSVTASGNANYSGGIVGIADGTTIVTNCFNTGNVTASGSSIYYLYSGGIVGLAYNNGTTNITNCYNTGNLFANNKGGIMGYCGGNYNTSNCYYLSTCGGNNMYGGQSLSADAMKSAEFVSMLNNGTNVWVEDSYNVNQGYPIFSNMSYIRIITSNATNVTYSHATLNGEGFSTETIIAQGFEYRIITETNYQSISVSNSGEMSKTLSELTPGIQYTYRTFCVMEGLGTIYGNNESFTTLAISVTTTDATNVTQSHATVNGNLNTGDANISSQGFQYKRTSDSEYQTISVSGSDDISATLSNLAPNTQYRFRAFCTPQGCETVYGQEKTFNTLTVSVTTNNATNVTQSHATLNGNLNIGDANISSQGFQYKRATDSEYQTVAVSGSGDVSTTLSNLTLNSQYRFRAFCIPQGCEPIYGQEKTFNTLTINVTTYAASNVTESSATLNGYIDAGDAEVTNKGFKYWPTNNPQNVSTVRVSTTGGISATINNLAQNTYQYRAFAESDGNMYQGEIRYFEISWLNNDTIFVYDADKLHWVAEQCNGGVTFEGKCVKLMNDIELPLNVPNNMISIGSYPSRPFKGTFDGNGKHIYNLYIDQPNTPYQGFFGYTLNANLYNVGLVNITASGRNYTGGMVAYAQNTHLRDCYVNGGTLFALSYCGGLIGYQEQGTNSIVSGCYNTCEVTGNNYVGGLIGFSNYSTVRNSYVAGRVAAQGEPVGAIIGGANEVLMYYCYFSIDMTGQTNAIGENNFKDGEGLTNEQMRDPQFVATLNQGLVTPVWKSDYASPINNGFPIIMWQEAGTTGIEESNADKSIISLYPNPANNYVIIQSDDSSVSLKHMEVYDIMGRKVISKVLDGQSKEFSIDKLHAGVYHVRVLTDNGHYTNIKLVVQ